MRYQPDILQAARAVVAPVTSVPAQVSHYISDQGRTPTQFNDQTGANHLVNNGTMQEAVANLNGRTVVYFPGEAVDTPNWQNLAATGLPASHDERTVWQLVNYPVAGVPQSGFGYGRDVSGGSYASALNASGRVITYGKGGDATLNADSGVGDITGDGWGVLIHTKSSANYHQTFLNNTRIMISANPADNFNLTGTPFEIWIGRNVQDTRHCEMYFAEGGVSDTWYGDRDNGTSVNGDAVRLQLLNYLNDEWNLGLTLP